MNGRAAKKHRLTSFQKRFKYIHDTYPPQVFVALFEAAMGHRDGEYGDLEFGAWCILHELTYPDTGYLPEDATEADAARWLLDELLAGRHYSENPIPATSELEPILPWAAAKLNRILRKPDPKDAPNAGFTASFVYPYQWPEVKIRGTARVGKRRGTVTVGGEFVPEGTIVTLRDKYEPLPGQKRFEAYLDGRLVAFDSYPFQPPDLDKTQQARTLGSTRLLTKLHEIAHWQAATHADLGRLTHRQVLHRQARWHGGSARELKPGGLARGGEKTADVGKWSLWRLETSDAIRSEGAAMGHCLGRFSEQFQRLHNQSSAFFSLRDDKGRSRITFEVDLLGSLIGSAGCTITQAKGPGNHPPGVKRSIAARVDRSRLPDAEALEGFARRARSRVIDWEEIEKLEQVVQLKGDAPGAKPLPRMRAIGRSDAMGLALMLSLRDRGVDNWRQIGQGKPMPVPKGRGSRRRRRRR